VSTRSAPTRPQKTTDRAFDRKFGEQFLKSLPKSPGVYRVYDAEESLIYVGKAKDLRKRLAQYRNAKRTKAHRKMRSIIAEAARIEYSVHESEAEALIQETISIQNHRPKWNVASAYFFLYPYIAIRQINDALVLSYTTEPETFSEFELFGAFRSRESTREVFYALHHLLTYLFHPIPKKRLLSTSGIKKISKFSRITGFRQSSPEILQGLRHFLRGEKITSLDSLIFALLEKADARHESKEVQNHLNTLKRFYRRESALLNRACSRTQYASYPVQQKERDLLFVRSRFSKTLAKK
jgi:excinuclease UvrABC nuclease subunit